MVAAFKLWEHPATREEISKASTYAISVPPADSVSVSKGSTYAIGTPAGDSASVSKASTYTIAAPGPGLLSISKLTTYAILYRASRRRRYVNVHPAAKIGTPTTEYDPWWGSVKLLMGFEGLNGATSSPDESPVGRTMTFLDGATLDTAQKKFGLSSLLLDGAADAVQAADSNDWDFGAGQFTVELWIRPSAGFGSNGAFIGRWGTPAAVQAKYSPHRTNVSNFPLYLRSFELQAGCLPRTIYQQSSACRGLQADTKSTWGLASRGGSHVQSRCEAGRCRYLGGNPSNIGNTSARADPAYTLGQVPNAIYLLISGPIEFGQALMLSGEGIVVIFR
jgi:hypothetical protein